MTGFAGQLLAMGMLSCLYRTYASPIDAWVPMGNMITPRVGFGMTTLADGRIIVAGGRGENNKVLASTEIWDNELGSWTPVANLTNSRSNLALTPLKDGRVLAIGGCKQGTLVECGLTLKYIEVYDVNKNLWMEFPPLILSRQGHAAVTLWNGTVIVAGGKSEGGIVQKNIEVLDVTHSSWSLGASMTTARYNFGLSLLVNQSVLATGGRGNFKYNTSMATAEIFNPITNNWTATNNMSAPRSEHESTTVINGSVVVVGGQFVNGTGVNETSSGMVTVELFDPNTGNWSFVGNITQNRTSGGLSTLKNGTVILAGGIDMNKTLIPTIELWDLGPPPPPDYSVIIYSSIDFGAVLVIIVIAIFLHKQRKKKLAAKQKIKEAAIYEDTGSVNGDPTKDDKLLENP